MFTAQDYRVTTGIDIAISSVILRIMHVIEQEHNRNERTHVAYSRLIPLWQAKSCV